MAPVVQGAQGVVEPQGVVQSVLRELPIQAVVVGLGMGVLVLQLLVVRVAQEL